jgi:hypothetical protein
MKLECEADPRAWAVVVDVWTRRLLREFYDILSRTPPVYETLPKDDEEAGARQAAYQEFGAKREADLLAYLHRVVKDAHMVDADGNELAGIDAIMAADQDGIDAAVTAWWGNLPGLAYQERQKMGEARRVN